MSKLLQEDTIRTYLDSLDAQTSPSLWSDVTEMARELLWRRTAERTGLSREIVTVPDGIPRMTALAHTHVFPQHVNEGCKHFMGHCNCDLPNHLRCDYVDEYNRRCMLGSGIHQKHKFGWLPGTRKAGR